MELYFACILGALAIVAWGHSLLFTIPLFIFAWVIQEFLNHRDKPQVDNKQISLYNVSIMKKEILNFEMPKLKHRAHQILFAENTPFTPKVVKNKTTYNRKSKHKNKDL